MEQSQPVKSNEDELAEYITDALGVSNEKANEILRINFSDAAIVEDAHAVSQPLEGENNG